MLIRAITTDDLSALAALGLDKATALRALSQDMGWVVEDRGIKAAATTRLTDGCLFIDVIVGQPTHRLPLIDHVIDYAKWSFAPAVVVEGDAYPDLIEKRGFVGLDHDGLPSGLMEAGASKTLLMKRL